MILERVSLSQPRFQTPGLALDNRGVALGPRGIALFGGLDRLVRFLRAYSQESPFDDLGALQVIELKSRVGVRHFALALQLPSSHVADRVARTTRLFGGQLYIGERRHFVQYRDAGAPLGYDVVRLAEDDSELVLYAESTTHFLAPMRTIDFLQLLLRLEPLPRHLTDEDFQLDEAWIVTRGEVGERLLSHLYRRGVRMEAGLLPPHPDAVFAERLGDVVVKAMSPSPSLIRLLQKTPGCLIFAPALDHVLVELGWEYPLRLTALSRWLTGDRTYFFSGSRGRVEVVKGALRFVQGELLIEAPVGMAAAPAAAVLTGWERISVGLRLVQSGEPARPIAAIVPWERAADLRRLVFALPPPMLSSLRAVGLDRGIFIVGGNGLGLMPGALYVELAPKVLVPIGHALLPRVDANVLTETLVGARAALAVVLAEGPPFLVEESQLQPLGRALLGTIEWPTAAPEPVVEPLAPGTVQNDPPPWWGFLR